jgi:hypothetical protein
MDDVEVRSWCSRRLLVAGPDLIPAVTSATSRRPSTAWWASSRAPIALINPKKKGIVAYCEAGHVPVAESRGHADRASQAGRRRRNASGYRGVAAATVASTIEENSHTGSDHAAN